MDNITKLDRLKGEAVFIYKLFQSSFDYSLVAYLLVDNWYDAVLMRGGFKKNGRLKMRQKSISKTISGRTARLFARNIKDYHIDGKDITIRCKDMQAKFHYANDYQLVNTITGIKEQLLQEQYSQVDVRNKNVLDIGASCGDSAIYFGLNGAKSVIALEPYPFTYGVAQENIRLNNLQNKVLLVNQACRGESGNIVIDPKFQNNDRDALRHFKKGKKIKVTTLGDLVKKYRIEDGTLKVDCEGYEYEIIGGASTSTLRKFDSIAIEYHYGFRNLESRLRGAGFDVRHTEPFYMSRVDDKVNVLCGFIFAQRR